MKDNHAKATNRLAEFFEIEGVSRKEFAKLAGFANTSSLDAMVRGSREITRRVLETIAKHYPHINTNYLLGGPGQLYNHSYYDKQEGGAMEVNQPVIYMGHFFLPVGSNPGQKPLPAFLIKSEIDHPKLSPGQIVLARLVATKDIAQHEPHVVYLSDGTVTIRTLASNPGDPHKLMMYSQGGKIPTQAVPHEQIQRVFYIVRVVSQISNAT